MHVYILQKEVFGLSLPFQFTKKIKAMNKNLKRNIEIITKHAEKLYGRQKAYKRGRQLTNEDDI